MPSWGTLIAPKTDKEMKLIKTLDRAWLILALLRGDVVN